MRNVFMGAELGKSQDEAIQRLMARLPEETVNVSNDPLVPDIQFGEVGDDNRAPATISLVPFSSTYDVPQPLPPPTHEHRNYHPQHRPQRRP